MISPSFSRLELSGNGHQINDPSGSHQFSWLDHFASPPAQYRPVPFWSWNEWMEPLEVARQVALMAEAGWGGAFVHARMGLLTPYLGDEWFAACAATLKACREHGLIAWLYDEDKWPSGFSGGSVPLANPDYRHKALIARSVDLPAPPDCSPLGEPKDGIQVYRWLSPLGDPWFNGTTYADLLSAKAMRRFLDDAYEPYFERFGDDYGSLIVAQFTDEPCSSYRSRLPKGAIPYSDELAQQFEVMHGYDPLPQLSLLFNNSGEGAQRFRLHYFQTVAHLFEHNFSAQLGKWCEEHGIALTGHYILEGTLYHQKLWGTQIMPHYRHQGIPGIDHLGRQIEERITGKQCQSVANQYGKKRVLSELYGVAGGGLSFEDRWWIATQQITLGVNVLNPHLSLYTMAGCRKRDYPQNLFYQQPWWRLNNAVDDPLSRLCVALSQGKYRAEMLVIHPQQSTFVLWEATQGDGVETIGTDWHPITKDGEANIRAIDADFQALTNALLGAQRTFDYGDETIMKDDGRVEMTSDGPSLIIGQMSYPLVILPTLETVAATTFALLREFQRAGGAIVRCGQAPSLLDGEVSPELNLWLDAVPSIALEELPTVLSELWEPLVSTSQLAGEDARLLWTHIRDLENGERLVWLVNLNRNRDFETQINLRGQWSSVNHLDVRTGLPSLLEVQSSDDGSKVKLPFARTQGHLLHLTPFAKQEGITLGESIARVQETINAADSIAIEFPVPADELKRLESLHFKPIDNQKLSSKGNHSNGHIAIERELQFEFPAGLWNVERLDDNALTLDCARWKAYEDWSTRAMPVIAIQQMLNRTHYRGPLSLNYSVNVGQFDLGRKCHLVLERPENYRVTVNGILVEPADLPFWRDIRWIPFDITGLLQTGANEIVLQCTDFQFGDPLETHDQPARYGTEIESIYLIGDFGVAAEITGEEPKPGNWEKLDLPLDVAVRCIAQESIHLVDPQPLHAGDTVDQGLPFYAGRLKFTAPLPKARGASKLTLGLGQLDGAVAQVEVNGENVGTIWSHPLEIELPTESLEGGTLSITLFGTLRNLLGPHHHIAGEIVQVGPSEFAPTPKAGDDAEGAGYAVWLQRWMAGETAPTDWNDRYCLLAFGDMGTVSLRYQ